MRQTALPPVRASSGSNRSLIVVGCMMLALAGFAFWKYKHRVHLDPGQASAEGFDEARKAFEEDHYAQALKGFAPLADAGNAKAQYYMGRMYGYSWSERPFDSSSPRHAASNEKQIEWFTKAAEQGDMLSQIELAKLYEHGFGPNADRAPAAQWWHKAAEQGDAEAQFSVGYGYANATDGGQDLSQAMNWYRQSAAQEYDRSLAALGGLYEAGTGVTKSNFIAYEFYSLAVAADARNPNRRYGFFDNDAKRVADQLTERERSEADQFVAAWKKGQALPQ